MAANSAMRATSRAMARVNNRCLSCEADISHKRADAKFCGETCRARYTRRWAAYRARKLKATVRPFTQDGLYAHWVDSGINPDECYYCGGPHEHDDHFIPLSRGGTHEVSNLVPACEICNCSKKDKLLEEWLSDVSPSQKALAG